MGYPVTSVPFRLFQHHLYQPKGQCWTLSTSARCLRSAAVVGMAVYVPQRAPSGSQGGAVASGRETFPGGQPRKGGAGPLGRQLSLFRDLHSGLLRFGLALLLHRHQSPFLTVNPLIYFFWFCFFGSTLTYRYSHDRISREKSSLQTNDKFGKHLKLYRGKAWKETLLIMVELSVFHCHLCPLCFLIFLQ